MSNGSGNRRVRLLKQVTCPHCWKKFPPEEVLWIASHNDLIGDPMLREFDSQRMEATLQRFRPTRFDIDGRAIDAKGFPCTNLACPHCHLAIPQAVLELPPTFLSITGAPASGKSIFLASMIWELRRLLTSTFSISFQDTDTLSNQMLNDYEAKLFMNPAGDDLTPLLKLVEKTQETHEGLFNEVSYGSQVVNYPKPFQFSLFPNFNHPNYELAATLGRVVCLYDNAGESFLPGKDTTGSPVTRHLAEAASLMFVFDPTMDPRFRALCQGRSELQEATGRDSFCIRQEPILQEVANRVRHHAQLRQSERHKKPLMVILTKYDLWMDLLDPDNNTEPWREVPGSAENGADDVRVALDIGRIENRSLETRDLLLQNSPEIVAAAESFAEEVLYVPVSSLGLSTTVNEEGQMSIRPAEIYPFWVTVPMLYAFSRILPGLVPVVKRRPASDMV